jgi:hypothetical protein
MSNRVNCWKAKSFNIDKPISSQVFQGWNKGSTTSTWRLEQSVKCQECATPHIEGEDIV